MNFWEILGISPTTDLAAIRHAYAEKTRACHPEEDPEGFTSCTPPFRRRLHAVRPALPPGGPGGAPGRKAPRRRACGPGGGWHPGKLPCRRAGGLSCLDEEKRLRRPSGGGADHLRLLRRRDRAPPRPRAAPGAGRRRRTASRGANAAGTAAAVRLRPPAPAGQPPAPAAGPGVGGPAAGGLRPRRRALAGPGTAGKRGVPRPSACPRVLETLVKLLKTEPACRKTGGGPGLRLWPAETGRGLRPRAGRFP